MSNLDNDFAKLSNIGNVLNNMIDNFEKEISKVDTKDKSFLLSQISELRCGFEKGKTNAMDEVIENLKRYDSNR